MELLIILLIYIVFLWWLTLIISRDVFCPSAIICESYIIALLCAIYNCKKWNSNLHLNTFFIILFGIVTFLIASSLYKTYGKKVIKSEKEEISIIRFKKINIIVLDIIAIIIAIFYLKYFFKAINSFNVSSFSEKMEIYRNKTTYEGYVYIPTIVNFLAKMCRALAIIYAYIIINNGIYNKFSLHKYKDSNFIYYVIGIITYIPLSIFSGARFDIIVYAITCVMMWYILYRKYSNKKIEIKKIIKIASVFVIIAFIFSETRNLVGRNNNSNGFLDYFTQYFGGSIHCFDLYMQQNNENNGVFGQELFIGIRKFLYQIHVLSQKNNSKDIGKFVYMSNGEAIGNIYSAYRNMYHDFGYMGIIIFQIILSIIFNKFYNYVLLKNKSKNNEKIDYGILVYSTIIFCLFFHSYSEYFYSTVLSFNYIMLFVWMKLILIWLNKVKIL